MTGIPHWIEAAWAEVEADAGEQSKTMTELFDGIKEVFARHAPEPSPEFVFVESVQQLTDQLEQAYADNRQIVKDLDSVKSKSSIVRRELSEANSEIQGLNTEQIANENEIKFLRAVLCQFMNVKI